jgi:hypothetical protein
MEETRYAFDLPQAATDRLMTLRYPPDPVLSTHTGSGERRGRQPDKCILLNSFFPPVVPLFVWVRLPDSHDDALVARHRRRAIICPF